MPEHRGRPKIYTEKTAEITFRIGESVYADISRFATEHGLSVPMYVAMMLNLHRNGVLDDERARDRESARV